MKKGYTIRIKYKIIFSFIMIISIFTIFIYEFDKTVMPTVIAVSEAEMRAKAIEIMNKTIIDEFMKQFNYNDVIKIEKDKNGNIVLLKADTLILNKIACDVAIKAQKALSDLGNVGIQLPIGYIMRNNVLSYFGPSIKIKMQPIGFIETRYSSEFESVGINQTRHKIYINMKTKIRIIIPVKSSDVEVSNEIPIAETIIVGKIPKTAIQMDLNDAGFRLKNFSD